MLRMYVMFPYSIGVLESRDGYFITSASQGQGWLKGRPVAEIIDILKRTDGKILEIKREKGEEDDKTIRHGSGKRFAEGWYPEYPESPGRYTRFDVVAERVDEQLERFAAGTRTIGVLEPNVED